jgi:hypothetical protein
MNSSFVARVDVHVRGPAEVRGVAVAAGLVGFADLEEKFPVAGELEYLMILCVVAADPHVVLIVDEDPVLVQGPLVARAGAAPRAHQPPVAVELEDGRRRCAAERARRIQRCAALVLGQGPRPLDDPDVIVAIDRDAGGLTDEPVVRQGLGPPRIDLELGRLPLARPLGRDGAREDDGERDQRYQRERAGHEPEAMGHAVVSSSPKTFARSS